MLPGLIKGMLEHAKELEARDERHLYGPAINEILILKDLLDDAMVLLDKANFTTAALRDQREQLTEKVNRHKGK